MLTRTIEQFLAVAEHGSISGAAHTLNISQPALTKNIRRLEAELGVRLFERLPRGVSLTHAGEVLLRRTRQMDLERRHAIEEIRFWTEEERGLLRVAAGPMWSLVYLPAVVAKLYATYPNARVEVETVINNLAIPQLAAGRIDLHLGVLTGDLQSDVPLVQEDLTVVEHVIFARRNHPLAGRTVIRPEDAVEYPWVTFQHDSIERGRVESFFNKGRVPLPHIVVETRTMTVAIAIVREGDFLVSLPRPMERLAESFGVAPLNGASIGRFSTGAVYRPSTADLPICRRFLEILRAEVAAKGDGVAEDRSLLDRTQRTATA